MDKIPRKMDKLPLNGFVHNWKDLLQSHIDKEMERLSVLLQAHIDSKEKRQDPIRATKRHAADANKPLARKEQVKND